MDIAKTEVILHTRVKASNEGEIKAVGNQGARCRSLLSIKSALRVKSQNLGDLDPVKLTGFPEGPGPYQPLQQVNLEQRLVLGGLVIQLEGLSPWLGGLGNGLPS